jgi:hypothetical protein
MARRNRTAEGNPKGSGTLEEPIIVEQVDPTDEHPSLGPMRRRKAKKLLEMAVARRKRKADKPKAKVKVDVEVA